MPSLAPGTLRQWLEWAQGELSQTSDTAQLDAEVLLAHCLQQPRTYLLAHDTDSLKADLINRFQQLVAARREGQPVAYLTGTREFWSLSLDVTADTLIPRPETELLVELALEHLPAGSGCRVADIGTGSGAIALAIASERPDCRVVATDNSPKALLVATGNAQRLGITNVDFRPGDLLRPLGDETFHLIASNPPYIAETDLHLNEGDVRFEPRSALISGKEGLDVIRKLVAGARDHLIPGGWLMFEHGYDQRQAVNDLFTDCGYREITCHTDLAGLPRVTVARMALDPPDR